MRPRFSKGKKKLDEAVGTRVNNIEKLLDLAAKNEDIPFFVTPANVPFLVKNTINYCSSEGLCQNQCFALTLFAMKFISFNLEKVKVSRSPGDFFVSCLVGW